MKLPRRKVCIGSGRCLGHLDAWWAQTYPAGPVRLIVPFPAGGQIDIIVRLIGQWLREFISLLGALSAACDLPACFYAKAGGLDSYGNDFQPISEVS